MANDQKFRKVQELVSGGEVGKLIRDDRGGCEAEAGHVAIVQEAPDGRKLVMKPRLNGIVVLVTTQVSHIAGSYRAERMMFCSSTGFSCSLYPAGRALASGIVFVL